MERVFFLMSQALDEDEAGNAREALQLYGQAVELCLQAVRQGMIECDDCWQF